MIPPYLPSTSRYDEMPYERCGKSGILLPRISLGMWQNFGADKTIEQVSEILHYAFDHGIVSIDLANNYGPPPGAAETQMGEVLRRSLHPYRDELMIATKAGYDMWPGPYGNWGSRKSLMASIDQSLRRLGTDYVDIFYSHRYDPSTPLEETLQALSDIVRQGKALYVGISRWPLEAMKIAIEYLRVRDTPCLIYQDRLNIFDRHVEQDHILPYLESEGVGFIGFTPLAEGMLTSKYLNGVPEGSRAARGSHLKASQLTPDVIARIRMLNDIAESRGQTLAQMAVAWILNHTGVTSVIAGCSRVSQLEDTIGALKNTTFTTDELLAIDTAATSALK